MNVIGTTPVIEAVAQIMPPPYEAVRLEVLRDGLKISVSVGWPEEKDDEEEDQ